MEQDSMVLAHHVTGEAFEDLRDFRRTVVFACSGEDVAVVSSETDCRHGYAVLSCGSKNVVSCQDFGPVILKYCSSVGNCYLYVVVHDSFGKCLELVQDASPTLWLALNSPHSKEII